MKPLIIVAYEENNGTIEQSYAYYDGDLFIDQEGQPLKYTMVYRNKKISTRLSWGKVLKENKK